MDSQPDFLRAGEHDAVDAVMAPQRLTRLGAMAREIVEESGRQSRVAIDLIQLETGPRRVLRGLVDDGIAGNECG